MKTSIKIMSIFGKLLFEYECEENSIKKTVEQAVKEKADLSFADLRSADLSFAKNKEIAFLPMFCKWSVSIIGDKIKIGCKEITIENWDLFFESSEEFDTKRNTEEFKQIQAMYLAYKAYLTHLTS